MNLPDLSGVKITAIAAMDKNGVIGANNDLPWRLPDDLKAFKKLTVHRPIIMGRKTYESIGRPLPKRANIILTRDPNYTAEGCLIAQTIEQAVELATGNFVEKKEIIIGGGGVIYTLFLPLLTHMVLTKVDAEIDGDTWFPKFDETDWTIEHTESHPADDRHDYGFETFFYKRA